MINDRDELVAEMVGFFGKLPEQWWEKWEARADFFDENGKRIGLGGQYEVYTLEMALNHKIEVFEMGGEDKKVLDMSEEEQRLLKDLVTKLLNYTPGDRLSVAEVVQHDWFKM
jgi:serine/threonine-protein kinase SRPK3